MIRNILVPTDFSSGSDTALACATELAGALGASLHVMHVVENPFVAGGFAEVFPPTPNYYRLDEHERQAREQLDACLSAADKIRLHAVLTTTMGVPAEEILRRLEQDPPIELVVMATHGRGGVARLMMGSVADKVIRRATCPVLTVKESPARETGPPG